MLSKLFSMVFWLWVIFLSESLASGMVTFVESSLVDASKVHISFSMARYRHSNARSQGPFFFFFCFPAMSPT